MAEALATQYGLQVAVSMGANDIETESTYSMEVIHYCSGQEQIWNEAMQVYADCGGVIGKVEF
jgi:hypothetical protein